MTDSPTRLAFLPDFPEEGWLGMDYVAEKLAACWFGPIRAESELPQYRKLLARVWPRSRRAFNVDRMVNRFWRYPRFAGGLRAKYDYFHIIDHSYAHLAHSLPRGRAGVYCHDLDAFASVLTPNKDPRPRWYRAMARHQLRGLQKAAVIFTISHQTRDQLLRNAVVDPARVIYAPLGISGEFMAEAPPDAVPPHWLHALAGRHWILHVGSCIPRKRIDVLLNVFADARQQIPDLRLVKVSGQFSAAQSDQIRSLQLTDAIIHVSGLSRRDLAAVYRAAPLVLMPSEAEGFGLPAAEAVACGTLVLASDIPALREAGGDAAVYRPVADREAWTAAVVEAIRFPEHWPGPALRAAQAARFSWPKHIATISGAYESLAAKGTPA